MEIRRGPSEFPTPQGEHKMHDVGILIIEVHLENLVKSLKYVP